MKQRPLGIKLVSFFLVMAPLVALGIIVSRIGVAHLTLLNPDMRTLFLAFSGGSLLASLGVYLVRPWGFFAFLLFCLSVFAVEIRDLITRPETFSFWNISDALFLAGGIFLVTRPTTRRLFFNADLRWWERAKRYEIPTNGLFRFNDGTITGPIMNMSTSGCLIRLPRELGLGEPVYMVVRLGEKQSFDLKGKVARIQKTASTMDPSREFGIHFEPVGPIKRWRMQRALHDFSRNA